jgi:hypothetical protein
LASVFLYLLPVCVGKPTWESMWEPRSPIQSLLFRLIMSNTMTFYILWKIRAFHKQLRELHLISIYFRNQFHNTGGVEHFVTAMWQLIALATRASAHMVNIPQNIDMWDKKLRHGAFSTSLIHGSNGVSGSDALI